TQPGVWTFITWVISTIFMVAFLLLYAPHWVVCRSSACSFVGCALPCNPIRIPAQRSSMNMPAAPLIGQPVDRAEDRRFLTGAGTFVDDLKREGMLHAVILRSSVAHGRINGIDASAARARRGVRAVLTAAEIGASIPLIPLRLANLPEFASYLQPVIARDKVRYVGEPIAVVVAETRALAEDALDAIAVDIAPLPAVPDRHAAASGKSLLFE